MSQSKLPELAKMNPALRERAEFFLDWQNKEDSSTLRNRYALGRVASTMKKKNLQKDPGVNGDREQYFYGVKDPLEIISVLMVDDRAFLTDCVRFFDGFTEAQVEMMKEGGRRPLGWGHVRQLLSLRHADDRDAFLRECCEKGWTAVRLQQEIAKRVVAGEGRKTRQGAGRTPAPPHNADRYFAVCDNWISGTKERAAMLTNPDNSFTTLVQKDPARVTDEELQSLIEEAETRRTTTMSTIDELQKVISDLSHGMALLSQEREMRAKAAAKRAKATEEEPALA